MKRQLILAVGVLMIGLFAGCVGSPEEADQNVGESSAEVTIDPYSFPWNWETRSGFWEKKHNSFNNEDWFEGYTQNAYIQHGYYASTAGKYTFYCAAEGQYGGGAWPIINIYADGVLWKSVTIDKGWQTAWLVPVYATGYLSAGTHQIRIQFVNDYYAGNSNDRNVYIRGGLSFWYSPYAL
jgi:hypothetical protein